MSDDIGDDGPYYDNDNGGGFQWTRPAIAAAALLGAIAVLAVWVIWPNNGDSKPNAAPTTTTRPASTQPGDSTTTGAEAEPPPGPAGACPQDRQTSDNIPPPIDGTVTWDLYNGAAVPRSSTAGPLRVEDSGLARCYERSPSGAVLMAMNFNARLYLSPNPVSIASAQMVDSGEKASSLEKLAEVPAPISDPASFCQFVAYRVKSFNSDVATVELVNQCGANDLRVATWELRWIDDDWQIVLETPKDGAQPPKRVPSLAGYTPFRGVGG